MLRHRATGNVGLFLKEYKPTGKPYTTQIQLSDGRIYYAPSCEFEEIVKPGERAFSQKTPL